MGCDVAGVTRPDSWESPTLHSETPFLFVWLDHWARTTPDVVAVNDRHQSLTFAELAAHSARYAAAFRQHAESHTAPVVALLVDGVEAIAAFIGALRAGAVVLPLDVRDGLPRTVALLDRADPSVVVTDQHQLELGDRWPSLHPDGLVDQSTDLCIDDSQWPSIDPLGPAMMLFTSGSTGQPKGFVFSHTEMANFAAVNATELRIGPGDRLSMMFGLAFSASRPNLLSGLLCGASLCCNRPDQAEDLTAVAGWVRSQAITHFHTTPNILRVLVRAGGHFEDLPALRTVVLGGAAVSAADLTEARRALPDHTQLIQRYAATEVGVIARTVYDAGVAIDDVVLTQPLPGRHVQILDAVGAEAAAGESGDVVVSLAGPVSWPFAGAESLHPQPADSPPVATGDLGAWTCLLYTSDAADDS